VAETAAPRAPYPPDVDDDAVAPDELGDLVDVVVENRDWPNAVASRSSLRRVELRLCRLTGAELAESELSDVVFSDCRLDLTGLRFAKLERVTFRDCRMAESDLSGATLEDVVFERCELREATFSEVKVRRVDLIGCELAGLRGAEALRGARMPWHDILQNGSVFAGALGIVVLDE
jgi:uncharacterized protein YjbI with pentapeptide repeats